MKERTERGVGGVGGIIIIIVGVGEESRGGVSSLNVNFQRSYFKQRQKLNQSPTVLS